MTNEEAVAQGAQLFAEVEAALIALSAGLPGVINAVRDNGAIGGIEALARLSNAMVITNAALGEIVDLHSGLTERCKELGIDVPPPATTKSGVTPLSGGR